TVMTTDAVLPSLSAGSQPFETMHALTLHAANNPSVATSTTQAAGATSATQAAGGIPLVGVQPAGATSATLGGSPAPVLAAGDLLVFEEVLGHLTLAAQDADPTHRQVVRLTSVAPAAGGLAVAWAQEDALAFPLSSSTCVARGNVVLADHGQTLAVPEA